MPEPGREALAHLPADLLEEPLERSTTVAIGCPEPERLGNLTRLMEAVNIRLVPCGSAGELVEALRERKAGAAIRGHLPAREVKAELEEAFGRKDGLTPDECGPRGVVTLHRAVLVEVKGALRLVGPVGIDEGNTVEGRLELAERGSRLLARMGAGHMPNGWRPAIGVLSLGRTEDGHRGPAIAASLEAGKALTARLRENGHNATHFDIRIEEAAAHCDLLVTPDGTHGNLIFRTLHYLGDIPAWGAPVLGLWPEVVFVDSSRARASFAAPVKLAARLSVIERCIK